ncbi:three-fingered toxin-09 [Crotalus adamanteus]|uniref:Three-fingered toxin-06 n=1 Tax=Crotalus adamanteus TaxID=8729 RepID=A0AAW1BLJ7_CROAD
MKALLFALLLVAFLCVDPVTSLECYVLSDWKIKCFRGEKYCYNVKFKEPKICKQSSYLSWIENGCARRCPEPSHKKEVICCSTDTCNRFF